MQGLAEQVRRFRSDKDRFESEARQTAAFFLMSGIDLDRALVARGQERDRILARVTRLLQRERLKGVGRHWSYDLNRHIALKQTLDRLATRPENENGARRRHPEL